MEIQTLKKMYDLTGQVIVITGGAGVLCSAMSRTLANTGAKIALLDLMGEAADDLAAEIRSNGGQAIGIACDVLKKDSIETAARDIIEAFDHVDILINGAGGNNPNATTSTKQLFFDLPEEALRMVFELNLVGTILPSQIFGKLMAQQGRGLILNIASMTAFRPLTRIPAYSAAKAGVSNFTQWLAVHMAQEYSPEIRVNAIAPGFFLTEQNRFLLTDEESGDLTQRGQTIIQHTPMARFGTTDDLLGPVLWLISPASAFVTGIIVPVDGGFSAYGGV